MLIVGGYNREDEFISDSAEVLNLSPDLVRQHLLYHMFFFKKILFLPTPGRVLFPALVPLRNLWGGRRRGRRPAPLLRRERGGRRRAAGHGGVLRVQRGGKPVAAGDNCLVLRIWKRFF